jgi:hypothetical protein
MDTMPMHAFASGNPGFWESSRDRYILLECRLKFGVGLLDGGCMLNSVDGVRVVVQVVDPEFSIAYHNL